VCFDGKENLTKLKSKKFSTICDWVPFDNEYLRVEFIKIFEKIEKFGRNFSSTTLPGKKFHQKFDGRLEANNLCPITDPYI